MTWAFHRGRPPRDARRAVDEGKVRPIRRASTRRGPPADQQASSRRRCAAGRPRLQAGPVPGREPVERRPAAAPRSPRPRPRGAGGPGRAPGQRRARRLGRASEEQTASGHRDHVAPPRRRRRCAAAVSRSSPEHDTAKTSGRARRSREVDAAADPDRHRGRRRRGGRRRSLAGRVRRRPRRTPPRRAIGPPAGQRHADRRARGSPPRGRDDCSGRAAAAPTPSLSRRRPALTPLRDRWRARRPSRPWPSAARARPRRRRWPRRPTRPDTVGDGVAPVQPRVVEDVLVLEPQQRALVDRAGQDLEQQRVKAHLTPHRRHRPCVGRPAVGDRARCTSATGPRSSRRVGLHVEPQQRLGVRGPKVVPPVPVVDREAVEQVDRRARRRVRARPRPRRWPRGSATSVLISPESA